MRYRSAALERAEVSDKRGENDVGLRAMKSNALASVARTPQKPAGEKPCT
jgi:hypothetical protein